jgi:membrane-associated phospholipid phosphatase
MNNADDIGIYGRFSVGGMTSFPSGHTTWAMGVFTLAPLFYLLLKDKQKTLITLFSALFAFLLLIIFCRICGGYHYLSDIAMAIVVNTVPFVGVGYFVYCQPNKQK